MSTTLTDGDGKGPSRARTNRTSRQQKPDRFTLVVGDINDQPDCDAIVQSAGKDLRYDAKSGKVYVSKDSYEASGNTDVRPLRLAEAVVAPGFADLGVCTIYVRLPHYLNDPQPAAALAESVKALLRLARDTGCKRVALPPLSTGPLAYPLEEAAQITTREIKAFLARDKKLEEVRLVLPSPALYEVYRRRKVWG